jgi:hypothetical protein
MCILTNVHKPIAECGFCDECGRAHKPATVEDYNRNMDYINKGDRMTNRYSNSWK